MMYYINANRWTLRKKKTPHRFLMSKGTPVYLTVESEENILEESLDGLILDDSTEGCSLIIIKDSPLVDEQLLLLKRGEFCSLEIKDLEPIYGKITWWKHLDDLIVRVGIKYTKN